MPDEISLVSMPAWLFQPSESFNIAIDESSMAEYVRGPQTYLIPDAVDYCNEAFVWRGSFTPVIDLSLLLGDVALGNEHIAIVAYQEYVDQKPKYVGIKMLSELQRISVMDDSACGWPEEYPLEIQPIVESLFMHEEQVISILKIADLCNEGYRDYLMQLAEINS